MLSVLRKLGYLAVCLLVLMPVLVHAQNLAYQNFCQLGGTTVNTQGLQSTTKVQASYPKCTVTVYLTGTTTIAAIFSTAGGAALANPFQANIDGSFLFFAATTACYDVVTSVSTSGGTPPMPNPFTYIDICLGSGGGGGGGGGTVAGTPPHVAKFTGTSTVGDSSGLDPGNIPTQWPLGLNVIGGAGYLQDTVGSAGVTANLLVEFDSNSQIVTASASSAKPKGIADSGGVSGDSVSRAIWGRHNCVFDNQTALNDFVAPSATTPGECSDVGATKPNNVAVIGTVTSVNTGADTLAIVDLLPWDTIAPGASGGSGTVSNSSCTGVAYYPSPGTVIVGDCFFVTDGAGHVTMYSLGLLDSTYAGFQWQKQGPQPPAPPANTIQEYPPTSVVTYSVEKPGAAGSVGNCWKINSQTTDTNGNTINHMVYGACSAAGVEIQTSGVDNLSQILLNFQTGPSSFDGYQIAPSNPSGGNEQFSLTTPNSQISTPSMPTLTVGGTPGASTVSYVIVGCEDGPACGLHTAASSVGTTNTANATLSSSPITLTAYADTLYGPRCYNVYRTIGGPSQGKIISCAWKKVTDTGLAGDGTTAPNTNNTVLYPSFSPLPACAHHPDVPKGVDTPPCSPKALDDEESYGDGTNQPGGTIYTDYTWLNQNSASATLTNGMITLTSPSRSSTNNTNCLIKPLGSIGTTYAFIVVSYGSTSGGSVNISDMLVLYESATGKLSGIGQGLNSGSRIDVLNFATVTSAPSAVFTSGVTNNYTNPQYLRIERAGANLNYFYSPDGVDYVQVATQAVTAAFTTAPDNVGVCVRNFNGVGFWDFDYLRQTE